MIDYAFLVYCMGIARMYGWRTCTRSGATSTRPDWKALATGGPRGVCARTRGGRTKERFVTW